MKIIHTLLAAVFIASVGITSADDKSLLIRLYEEEILAHDLYVVLGKEHPRIMPLSHIPHSEKRHQGMMAEILKDNGIALPKPAKGERFVSDSLNKTYDQWFEEGKKSEMDACRVGVRLEEFDIADLREAQEKLPKYKETLSLLEFASGNHLRAFHRNLTKRGGNYEPKALSKAEYEKILANESTCCAGGGQSAGKGKKECKDCKDCKTDANTKGDVKKECKDCKVDAKPKGAGKKKCQECETKPKP